MANKGASANTMHELHDALAGVFLRVMRNYTAQLDAGADVGMEDLTDALIASGGSEPSPAMMSAVSKFLNDNSISYDEGAVAELSAIEQQRKNKLRKGGNGATVLKMLRVTDEAANG